MTPPLAYPFLDNLERHPGFFSSRGNEIEVLFDGDAIFDRMLEDISQAREWIHVEIYTFASDAVGRRFADAFAAKAREGVPVCIVRDGIGSLEADSKMFAALEEAGVELEVFRPPNPLSKRFGLLRRNHRKNLIIDGHIAFLGGLNFTQEWSRRTVGSSAWRDTHLRLEGPAAQHCNTLFLQTWKKVGRPLPAPSALHLHPPSSADPAGSTRCWVIGGKDDQPRHTARRLYELLLQKSHHKVLFTVPYFVPPRSLLRQMSAAEKRGVEVEILVPRTSDVSFADSLRQSTYPAMMRRGLTFFEYLPSILHAKTIIADDRLAVVGSANLDYLSMGLNWEVLLLIEDPQTVATLREQFQQDLTESEQIQPGWQNSRQAWPRLKAWLARLFIRLT